jgi:hypothetical protein
MMGILVAFSPVVRAKYPAVMNPRRFGVTSRGRATTLEALPDLSGDSPPLERSRCRARR